MRITAVLQIIHNIDSIELKMHLITDPNRWKMPYNLVGGPVQNVNRSIFYVSSGKMNGCRVLAALTQTDV